MSYVEIGQYIYLTCMHTYTLRQYNGTHVWSYTPSTHFNPQDDMNMAITEDGIALCGKLLFAF